MSKRTILVISLVLLIVASGRSQGDSTPADTGMMNFGYLTVECDSPGINIYVDDMLAGQAPIERPIPLLQGKHTVTYLQPEFLDLLRRYYDEAEIRRLISRALVSVYIVPGQTISVNLWWKPYDRELRSRKLRIWVKSFAGLLLMATLLVLNLP